MNRVLCYLRHDRDKRLKARFLKAAEELQDIVGDAVEVSSRSIDSEMDGRLLSFYLTLDVEPTTDLDSADVHLHGELLRIVDELLTTADRLAANWEGGPA